MVIESEEEDETNDSLADTMVSACSKLSEKKNTSLSKDEIIQSLNEILERK